MAFDVNPSGYFYNKIVCDASLSGGAASGIFINYDALESVSGVTGNAFDIRELTYSFVERVADVYLNLPTGSGSNQLSITRSSTVPNDSTIRKSYTLTVSLDLPATTVKDES